MGKQDRAWSEGNLSSACLCPDGRQTFGNDVPCKKVIPKKDTQNEINGTWWIQRKEELHPIRQGVFHVKDFNNVRNVGKIRIYLTLYMHGVKMDNKKDNNPVVANNSQ